MKMPVVQIASGRPVADEPLRYSDCRTLPPSYMSEYSVLGIVVEKLDEAFQTLRRNGLAVTREVFGAEVEVEDRSRLPAVFGMLAEAGLRFSMGDVVDSVYQG